jgi:hypothetical protein
MTQTDATQFDVGDRVRVSFIPTETWVVIGWDDNRVLLKLRSEQDDTEWFCGPSLLTLID